MDYPIDHSLRGKLNKGMNQVELQQNKEQYLKIILANSRKIKIIFFLIEK